MNRNTAVQQIMDKLLNYYLGQKPNKQKLQDITFRIKISELRVSYFDKLYDKIIEENSYFPNVKEIRIIIRNLVEEEKKLVAERKKEVRKNQKNWVCSECEGRGGKVIPSTNRRGIIYNYFHECSVCEGEGFDETGNKNQPPQICTSTKQEIYDRTVKDEDPEEIKHIMKTFIFGSKGEKHGRPFQIQQPNTH